MSHADFVLLEDGDNRYHVDYYFTRHRFLLDDGRVVDVDAWQDDSDLRAAVLKATGAQRIEGVAVVPAQERLGA